MEKSSKSLKECMEKIKVSSAEIVVHGTKEKPYYEIKYHDLSDEQIHIGYSSYNLDFVFEWLKECFEVVKKDKTNISEQIKELRNTAENIHILKLGGYAKIVLEADDTIESLSAKLQAEDCGGWVSCKERLPFIRNNILICQSDGYVSVGYYSYSDGVFLDLNSVPFENVVAWRELPEPYHDT